MIETTSNADMKMESASERETADLRLHDVLESIKGSLNREELEALARLQYAWEAYRLEVQNYARALAGPGSNATLQSTYAYIAETERRSDELSALLQERAAE